MGLITPGERKSERSGIVAEVEGIIHHRHELDAFLREARASLIETGSLPVSRIWDYLEWRRDRNPARFDHYHPEFVRLFHWAHEHHKLVPHESLPITPILIGDIVPGIVTIMTPPPVIPPPRESALVVPEPSSLTLAVWAIAVGLAVVAARKARIQLSPLRTWR
jgi:hypothetical protein